MTFNCGCCGELYPTIHRHYHHKIPQAAGGPDTPDNIIQLCPGCHDGLHSIAHKLISRKFSHAKTMDTLKILYKDNEKAAKMCYDLACKVRDAMVISAERGVDPTQEVQMGTSLPKSIKDLAIVRQRELGVSQEAYVRQLILSDLVQKFGSNPVLNSYLQSNSVKVSSRRRRR